MGMMSRLKENFRKEVQAIKMNREIKNDPDLVKSKIDAQRVMIKKEKDRLELKRALENDKKELQSLKNSTGIRGKISSGLKNLKTHTDNVRLRNEQSSKFKLRDSKQKITGGPMSDEKSRIGGPMGSSNSTGGPMGDKKKKKSTFL